MEGCGRSGRDGSVWDGPRLRNCALKSPGCVGLGKNRNFLQLFRIVLLLNLAKTICFKCGWHLAPTVANAGSKNASQKLSFEASLK